MVFEAAWNLLGTPCIRRTRLGKPHIAHGGNADVRLGPARPPFPGWQIAAFLGLPQRSA